MNIEKLKEIGNNIKAFLKAAKVELEETLTLTDGTAVMFEPAFETRATAMITSEEGTIPLADGSYTLDNGITFEIVSGTVSNISTASSEPTVEEELEKILEQRLSGIPTGVEITALRSEIAQNRKDIVALGEILSSCLSELTHSTTPNPTSTQRQAPTPSGNISELAARLKAIKESKNKNRD